MQAMSIQGKPLSLHIETDECGYVPEQKTFYYMVEKEFIRLNKGSLHEKIDVHLTSSDTKVKWIFPIGFIGYLTGTQNYIKGRKFKSGTRIDYNFVLIFEEDPSIST